MATLVSSGEQQQPQQHDPQEVAATILRVGKKHLNLDLAREAVLDPDTIADRLIHTAARVLAEEETEKYGHMLKGGLAAEVYVSV